MLRLRDDDVAFLRIVEGHDTSDRDAVGFSLKDVYLIKKSLYLYSIMNFPFYPIWDIINTLSYKNNMFIVSYE